MARKVLIADDEQNIVISLEFLLKREGFEVLVAGDGEAALQMVAEHLMPALASAGWRSAAVSFRIGPS